MKYPQEGKPWEPRNVHQAWTDEEHVVRARRGEFVFAAKEARPWAMEGVMLVKWAEKDPSCVIPLMRGPSSPQTAEAGRTVGARRRGRGRAREMRLGLYELSVLQD